jgi:hypothetical protein
MVERSHFERVSMLPKFILLEMAAVPWIQRNDPGKIIILDRIGHKNRINIRIFKVVIAEDGAAILFARRYTEEQRAEKKCSDSLHNTSRKSNTSVSYGRVNRPGGPARRVLRRRRDGSGRQLHAELACLYFFSMY